MSIDNISKAYSQINFRERPKQDVITRESLGVAINGPKTKRSPSPLERISKGFAIRAEQKEQRKQAEQQEYTENNDKGSNAE